MKKLLSMVLVSMLLVTTLLGCSSGGNETKETPKQTDAASNGETKESDTAGSDIDFSGTITMCAGTTAAAGLEAAMEGYQKLHPDVSLDITIAETVTDFETMMTTWISSDSLPDMYEAQVSTVQQQYAAEGYVMFLDDTGIMDNLVEGDTSMITYDGKFYTFPMTTAISVTLANNAKLKELGIELTIDNYPKCMDDFLDLLQECRDKGVEYPYGVAGADLSSCTAWPFQYMYQVLYGNNPNWYADVLSGEKDWSDPEFVEMFETYGKLTEYTSPDSLGKSVDGMYADFISGDTIFFSQVATTIKSIKELDPEMDIILLPSSFTEKPEDQTLISSFDDGISITTSAKNPELCIDFLKYVTSPEGSTLFNNASGYIPTVKGCETEIDPSYDIVFEIMQTGELPNSPILSRQWIAGFKELLKSGGQNWLAGEDPQSVADKIAEEHKRLMDASPDWVENFLDTYEYK